MEIKRRIHTVVHLIDPRTMDGNSLLHLSTMKNNILNAKWTQNMFEDRRLAFFPSAEVTKLLVKCGAKINALNTNANTPLHTASIEMNYRQEVSDIIATNPN